MQRAVFVLTLTLTLIISSSFAAVITDFSEGSRAARLALGFKEFVERVEKDRIERMAKEDPTLFERLLPYAMVLDVADEWAEKFRDLVSEPLPWYESPSYRPRSFHTRLFINDLGRGMNTMASTFTSAPRSSG